jgi:class 3 adenylate cyclase
VRCASCGFQNEAGNRFCEECGSSLAASCPSCGEPTRTDARFCRNCGHALKTDAPATAGATTAAPTAERRLVSVLFTDLVGFTALAEDRDPETVRELLSRYFETATQIVTLHGGTVEKFIGDAVMAVWGTPVAHEDDAERAVRAALEMVDAVRALHADLQARAGVMTGQAAVTLNAANQGMVAGDLVNTAARLQGVAEAGTVLVGEATMRAAERAVAFEPLGEHSLKGKTSPVPAWLARRVVGKGGGEGRSDALEAPFVGRDEELRQLKEVLHTVGRERRTRLVSITGPGGIGKSRLVWELEKYLDGVTETIWWHRGRSPSYGEGITFWALGEMVRRRAQLSEDDDEATTRARIQATLEEHVPDAAEREGIASALLTLLGVEPAPAGGREALFPAWRLFFERIAEKGTTALVFEDLQWADPGLLDFIDHMLEWSRAHPILIVTFARPELLERRPDWGTGRRNAVSLSLEPLSDEVMSEGLDGLVPGLPDAAVKLILERADGEDVRVVAVAQTLGHVTELGL